MNTYPIFIGQHSLVTFEAWLQAHTYSQVIVFTDEHTLSHCYPLLKPFLPEHLQTSISAGEIHKNLETCVRLWEKMTEHQFDRKGLVINLGGGVLGDMGGFVASTYKRGIDFVQIPTTLLAQVDASVGGKLGIDFQGFKNHIGLFQEPQAVVIWPAFLQTLPHEELRSGFAEVVKHHLIADRASWLQLSKQHKLEEMNWEALIQHSVNIKSQIVEQDFKESGIRKALNFGHTLGHAIETLRLGTAQHLLHGEAIGLGMIAESYISYQHKLITAEELQQISNYILLHFPKTTIQPQEVSAIIANMYQDKKNIGGEVRCTLLAGIGGVKVDYPLSEAEAKAGIAYYSSL